MKKICLFIFSLFLIFNLNAEIIETNEIADIINFVESDNQNSLILFNVTHTLYKPYNTMSDKRWRKYCAEAIRAQVKDKAKAEIYIKNIENRIVSNIPKRAVEEITPSIILELQNKKIPVLGFTKKETATSYAKNFDEITYKHLVSLGIDLNKTNEYFSVSNGQIDQKYTFAFGIIFTNKGPKDQALLAFLDQLDKLPTKIIIVDDSKDDLKHIEKALESIGIKFHGIHYTRCLKNQFNPVLGINQFLSYFHSGYLMSDEESLEKSIKSADSESAMLNYEHYFHNYLDWWLGLHPELLQE